MEISPGPKFILSQLYYIISRPSSQVFFVFQVYITSLHNCQILCVVKSSRRPQSSFNPCQISIAAAKPAASAALSSFHIAAANLKKLQNHAIIFIQRMREEKAIKLQNLSEILGVENLKKLQISAIIYIQGERKVTHRKTKKLIGS